MTQNIILDTGPLVAAVNRRDRYHTWAAQVLKTAPLPLTTCEAVITESCFLLNKIYGGQETILSLVEQEILNIAFSLEDEATAIQTLLNRYQSVPMSLADACLVRMSELHPQDTIITLDSDFRIYRRNRNQVIPCLMPDN